MVQIAERGSGIRFENGQYHVLLPGHGQVVFVLRGKPVVVCCSCHREFDDANELAITDPNVCWRCYAA
jgi:hypothetical protein